MPAQVYTIDVPGIQDIIKIPALEDEELRVQRAIKLKTKVSALPEALEWIPDVINTIDDAEDMLSVGLTLAKPLLRKIPAFFLPGLGWVLLAKDVADLTVGILGMTTTGRTGKAKARAVAESIRGGRRTQIGNVQSFLNKTNWFGFAIEAGQVLETFTGYGLQIGPIMSTITDAVWGAIRTVIGDDQLVLRGPPPADISVKAAQYLLKSSRSLLCVGAFEPEDLTLVALAHKLSTDILLDTPIPENMEERVTALEKQRIPIRDTWNEVTKAALAKAGVPERPSKVCAEEPGEKVRFGDSSRRAIASRNNWEAALRTAFGKTSHGTIMQMAMNESAFTSWDYVNGGETKATMFTEGAWDIILKAIDKNVEPYYYPSPAQFMEKVHGRNRDRFIECVAAGDLLQKFYERVARHMEVDGARFPRTRDLHDASFGIWLGRKWMPAPFWSGNYTDEKAMAATRWLRERLKMPLPPCPENCRVIMLELFDDPNNRIECQ